uniref:Uncharacterized protein n=1 Tax=Arundo donax TaxID=35708 RepID=A0A0A9HWV7_ARUDO
MPLAQLARNPRRSRLSRETSRSSQSASGTTTKRKIQTSPTTVKPTCSRSCSHSSCLWYLVFTMSPQVLDFYWNVFLVVAFIFTVL